MSSSSQAPDRVQDWLQDIQIANTSSKMSSSNNKRTHDEIETPDSVRTEQHSAKRQRQEDERSCLSLFAHMRDIAKKPRAPVELVDGQHMDYYARPQHSRYGRLSIEGLKRYTPSSAIIETTMTMQEIVELIQMQRPTDRTTISPLDQIACSYRA